jgi:hypothetical protein
MNEGKVGQMMNGNINKNNNINNNINVNTKSLSYMSLRELYERYIEAEDPAEIEALRAEIKKRIEGIMEMWGDIKKVVFELARNLCNAIRSPFVIKQYEREIQRVEMLLKYTKHDKLRQKHERYLKFLHKQVDEFRRFSKV